MQVRRLPYDGRIVDWDSTVPHVKSPGDVFNNPLDPSRKQSLVFRVPRGFGEGLESTQTSQILVPLSSANAFSIRL